MDKLKVRAKLIFWERKLRILLYGFCVYSLLYAVITNVIPKYTDSILHNYIFIVVGALFSFCAGLVIDEEVEDTKKEYEWDWKPKTKSDYYCTEFSGAVWIGGFYVVVQLGIGMIFFPWFDKIQIGEHYVYPYVFIVNSIIIYILYRLTIIKIEKVYEQDLEVK